MWYNSKLHCFGVQNQRHQGNALDTPHKELSVSDNHMKCWYQSEEGTLYMQGYSLWVIQSVV